MLFRPNKNIERANRSNRRLCIPEIPEDLFLEALKELVKVDEEWIPTKPGTSLYIRPFVIATDPFLGVRPSHTYKFMIILSPVGAYYESGLNPVKSGLKTNTSEQSEAVSAKQRPEATTPLPWLPR